MATRRHTKQQPPANGLACSAALLAAALLGPCGAVWAQQPASATPPAPIEEIIVTGTAGGAEMRKFDASYAITTTSADDIEKLAPTSTADLLKVVPGIWAESSGGVSGANVFVRGFPGAGDAPFLTVQVNGAPIYPPSTLSFLENTTLFRLDETVLRMEALRGGPNPVFSNGQPGLTTNFILREGGPDTEASVKYTTSDYDLRRFDGYVSGEISRDFYYMMGGYISSSPGIRDSGFNSDEGHQFTLNLTKDLENGSINFFTRDTDDHGTWYLPVALNVPGVDASYNQIGALNRQRQIRVGPDNTAETVNLGDGRGWKGSMSGGSVAFDVSQDWELVDRFSYTAGDADTLGLVPDGGAIQVGDFLANPANAIATNPGFITGPITGSVTGRAIGDSEYIQLFGAWEVRKAIDAFTNDVSIAKHWDTGSVTAGFYSASSSSDEFWSLGNQKYEVVHKGGEVVTGIACNDLAADSCDWNYDINATGDATTRAFYAATTFDVSNQLTLDFGLRRENHQVNYSVDEGLDGSIDLAIQFDESQTSWTAAANYLFNDTMGGFARINRGHRMPYFDDFRDNRGAYLDGNMLIQDVDQFELGFKWVTDELSLYTTLYHTKVDPSIFVALSGTTPGQISVNEANGIEIDGVWEPTDGFNLNLNATLQNSDIKKGANAGNETQRQPKQQFRLTPSYTFDAAGVSTTVYGTITSVGDRWSDPGNTVKLDSYHTVDLGALFSINDRLTVQVAGSNLTDEQGLTEGDPRNPSAPNGRFIMPRTLTVSIGYKLQ